MSSSQKSETDISTRESCVCVNRELSTIIPTTLFLNYQLAGDPVG